MAKPKVPNALDEIRDLSGAPRERGEWEPIRETLVEICRRIEQPLGADVETHREMSAARKRVLDAVYALAENALCALPAPPAPPAEGMTE